MKRQKTLTLMAVIVFVLCAIGLFAIAGCKADESEQQEQHEHTFMRVWSSDEEGHWHKASCEHKDVTTPKEPHVDENYDDECDICGYKIPHKHRYSETFSFNDTEHWREPICGDTLEQSERGAHKYGEAVEIPASCDEDGKLVYTCEVCGKTREEKLDATGHEFGASEVFEQPATCSATGVAAHWECLNCHKPFLKEGDDYVEVDPEELVLQINPDAHEWDAGTITDQPTCTHVGTLTIHCQYDYAHYYTEPIAELPHQWNGQICSVCGAERAYSFVDGDSFANSTLLHMGRYPQSKVEDDPTISSLSSKVNTTPSVENGWTNYKNFKSDDGKTFTDEAVADYWYIDVTLGEGQNADMYRGLYFTSYVTVNSWNGNREIYTSQKEYGEQLIEKQFQEANDYYINNIYWFKYEPIEWRILRRKDNTAVDQEGQKAIIMANIILDIQPFSIENSYNYMKSNVRRFLNETFYGDAFKEIEKNSIIPTTMYVGATSGKDNLFLLSYDEVAKEYCFGCGELWGRKEGIQVRSDEKIMVEETEEEFKKSQEAARAEIEYLKSMFGDLGWEPEHEDVLQKGQICNECYWGAQPRVYKTTDYAKALGAEVFDTLNVDDTNVRGVPSYNGKKLITPDEAKEMYYYNCSWWTFSSYREAGQSTYEVYFGTPTGSSAHTSDFKQKYGVLPAMWIEV